MYTIKLINQNGTFIFTIFFFQLEQKINGDKKIRNKISPPSKPNESSINAKRCVLLCARENIYT